MPNESEGLREKVTVEPAVPEDAQEILEVTRRGWLRAFVSEEAGITAEDIEDRFETMMSQEGVEHMAGSIASGARKFFVAKAGGKIVGTCGIIKAPGPRYNQPIGLFVDPEYEGKGIALMYTLRKELEQSKEDIKTDVVAYNEKALRLYKLLGFEQIGEPFERTWKTRRGVVKQPMVWILKKAKPVRE